MNSRCTGPRGRDGLLSFTFLLLFSLLFVCATGSAAQEMAAHTKLVSSSQAAPPASVSASSAKREANPVTPTRPAENTSAVSGSPAPRPVARLFSAFSPSAKNTETQPIPVAPLPSYTVTAETAQLEQRVFTLVNAARAKQGLPPLIWDEDAAKLARAHSAHMVQAGFFHHIDPQGRDAAARARELGIRGWRALGENIAYNQGFDQPADFAVECWLKSYDHRANILHTFFTHTAIGVAVTPDGCYYFTQIFLAR